jgi:hypothetical protein
MHNAKNLPKHQGFCHGLLERQSSSIAVGIEGLPKTIVFGTGVLSRGFWKAAGVGSADFAVVGFSYFADAASLCACGMYVAALQLRRECGHSIRANHVKSKLHSRCTAVELERCGTFSTVRVTCKKS